MKTHRGMKEILWNRRVRSWAQVRRLVRQAAAKLGWDPDIVTGLVDEHDYYSSPEFGFDILWFGDSVRIYMYSR